MSKWTCLVCRHDYEMRCKNQHLKTKKHINAVNFIVGRGMEQAVEKIPRKPRRPKYITEEARVASLRNSKTKYMTNKEWRCEYCDNYNYRLSGKYTHIQSKKHQDAVNREHN